MVIFSQNLKSHQWKDRVLLIIADSHDNIKLGDQIQELSKSKSGLLERKLVVYQVSPSSCIMGMDKDKIISSTLYKKYNADKKSFKVILIGLDGGVKKEMTSVTKAKDIFTKIDQMPMRRQELRSKNNEY